MPRTISAKEFLDLAVKSGVVTQGQLDKLRDTRAGGHDATHIADSMVASETLTRWQADKLLEGKHKGFFLGKYRLLSLIGRGGMGAVYLAEHTMLQRQCAIKVLPFGKAEKSTYLERFMREAQAVAGLDHPNIVRAYDVDRAEEDEKDIYFFAMEYVPGEDVQTMVRRSGTLSFVAAASILRQVAEGLAHAHDSGLVHRDIKPSNILVDKNKQFAKILDLGLVTFYGLQDEASLTQANSESLLGTADYVAPEQALDSQSADQRSDLYSLGCTFFYMLVGRPPFDKGTLATRLTAHQQQPIPALSSFRPDVPKELEHILEKLMAKNPQDRFQSAEAVVEAIDSWLLAQTESRMAFGAETPSVSADSASESVHAATLPPQLGDTDVGGEETTPQSNDPAGRRAAQGSILSASRRSLWAAAGLVFAAVLGFSFWYLGGPADSTARSEIAAARNIVLTQTERSKASVSKLVSATEHNRIVQFVRDYLDASSRHRPFSFQLGAKGSRDLLSRSKAKLSETKLDDQRVRRVLSWHVPGSRLSVLCDSIQYLDYPVVEWTVRLKNTGTQRSEVVSDLHGLDLAMSVLPPGSSPQQKVGHWNVATDWSFQPQQSGAWSFHHGWVAGWGVLTRRQRTATGLQQWTHSGATPWVGKNVGSASIKVDGGVVAPGQLVLQLAAGQHKFDSSKPERSGSCPGISWMCPRAGMYRFKGSLKNIANGGNGVSWNVHDDSWGILAGGDLNDSQTAGFEFERMLGSGERIILTMNDRGDPTADLTAVEFTVDELKTVKKGDVLLRYCSGSRQRATDFEPIVAGLGSDRPIRFASVGGRPTDGNALPMFNVGLKGRGVTMAVGWPGQWSAEFSLSKERQLQMRAGQQKLRCWLEPGEEIRTPLIVLQFHEGNDWYRAQNVWRRWMIAHNLPRPGGRIVLPSFSASTSHRFDFMLKATGENQIDSIDRHVDILGKSFGRWWMDAGWYQNNGSWENTGTWKADTKRFKGGLKRVCDYAHSNGLTTVVWFEPERVTPGTELYRDHPEWLLKQSKAPAFLHYQNDWRLVDMGNQQAREWITNRVSQMIRTNGISVYRHDFNIQPLYFWQSGDQKDRVGVIENHYVTGYLAYLDKLRELHPQLLIDTCANGGRRNDLETMRRSVPLWRSDFAYDPLAGQCQTYGMAHWYPYFGAGIATHESASPYVFRSNMSPHATGSFELNGAKGKLLKRMFREWTMIAPYFYGDFYPLTSYSSSRRVWMAWQFDLPEQGIGVVQAFRRSSADSSSLRVHLKGLVPDATYVVTDLDSETSDSRTGEDLGERGIKVEVSHKPGSVVLLYKRS